jgi:arylsulfatase A-like enzyme
MNDLAWGNWYIKRVLSLFRLIFRAMSGVKFRYYPDREPAATVVDKIIGYLDNSAREENVFLWAHFFDAHYFCHPPAEYLSAYRVNNEAYLEIKDQQEKYYGRGRVISLNPGWQDKLSCYPQIYGAALSYIDAALGRLFEYLKAQNLYDDCLIILTADHGENLLEDDFYYGHEKLNEAVIRVPLVIKFPANEYAGRDHSGIVSQLDIYPTIMGQYNYHLGPQSIEKMRGVNLVDVLAGRSAAESRSAICEHESFLSRSIIDRDWQLIEILPPKYWNPRVSQLMRQTLTADGNQLLRRGNNSANHINGSPDQVEQLQDRMNKLLAGPKKQHA